MAKIILITHQKGGVGKSTLTFNLASNLKESAKVCILDMDNQGSLLNISELSQVPIFTSDKLNEKLKEEYDFIFIDTPPYLSNQLPKLIAITDLIIVPTKAGILDLLAIKNTLEMIEIANRTDDTLIVFNMIKANTTLTLDILIGLEEYKVKIANTHISDLVSFTRSVLLKGVSKDQNAQRQIDQLTKEILLKLI